ncbi:TetR/AcrR family transcriptional regulator [Tellurirhabdus rosea]|uniref:TetR/AcrR family transcriptional regulator n=1 Tax=Tellurirhabdus rosea TaxID=2674997 RepID=UPI00225B2E25|nr:TetR/AcrR family transcriptional regulator [Tellurirhabdus rosea]
MEVKERIIKETEALFWKYGVRSITMDDIARQIGISKKTIYQHFTDKDDIVFQVMHYRMELDRKNADCQMAEIENPIEEMLMVSEMMRTQLATMNPSLIIDVQRHYPRAWQVFTDFKEKFVLEQIRENLRRGVAQGLYLASVDIEIMSRLRIELVQLGFNELIFPVSRSRTLADVQIQLLHHFIRGILTEKGISIYNQYLTEYRNEQASITG